MSTSLQYTEPKVAHGTERVNTQYKYYDKGRVSGEFVHPFANTIENWSAIQYKISV
jgi:hypothetical protein